MEKKLWTANGFVALGGNRKEAWQVKNAICRECAGTVAACDALDKTFDYEWFCQNEGCENNAGERSFDTEVPTWVEIRDGV